MIPAAGAPAGPDDARGMPVRINWVGVRNFLIIAGIAGLVLVWREGFGALAVSAEQIVRVLFAAALLAFGYNYFRQNQLAWLVLKPWQRTVIIVAGLGIVVLVVAGFELLGDRLTPLGVIALIAALVLLILWVLRESRRFR
jgi:hypothetical protein